MTVEEGDHAVVQKIGRRDRRLAIIELGASNLGVGVDKGLLVDTPDPLQIANIERVLGAAVARMLALKFAMRLLLGLGLFQRDELGLGQYQAFLGALGLQCFEPLVPSLEVMTLPHATHAGKRDREPVLPQLVGDADLAESRLLDGNRHDGVFDLLCDAVFQHWLLATDLLQRQLAAFVVKLLAFRVDSDADFFRVKGAAFLKGGIGVVPPRVSDEDGESGPPQSPGFPARNQGLGSWRSSPWK